MKIHPLLIALVTALVPISILLDITFLRQVVGFLFLTFIPGFLILKALRLRTEWIDSIFLSAGLSIAFLMFVGLAVNVLLPLLGFGAPLSLVPILVILISVTFGLLLIVYKRTWGVDNATASFSSQWKATTYILLSLLFFVPVLSILGSVYNNTLLAMAAFLLIALLGGLSFSSRVIPPRFHSLVIFVVAIALIFQASFISSHLMGWDVHFESYTFTSTLIKGYWSPLRLGTTSGTARFDSVLSITILPVIYSVMLGINSETLFKIIYPLFLSLISLVLYRTYEIRTGKSVAILAVFFVMFSTNFIGLEQLSLARQIVAELFLVLSIFLLVNETMPARTRQILFWVFGAALVVSHYAVAYFYLFLIVFYFIALRKWRFRNAISIETVLFLLAFNFIWYLYVSDAPFLQAVTDLNRISRNFFPDLSNPAARSSSVATFVASPSSIVSLFNRVVYLIPNFFVAVGILGLLAKSKRSVLNSAYNFLSIINFFVLVACLVVPNLAGTLNLSRFYVITMLFLAPYFVVGGETFFGWLHKVLSKSIRKAFRAAVSDKSVTISLVAVVLVVSFLVNTGFIDHVTSNYPTSYILDKDIIKTTSNAGIKISYYDAIVPDQDVFGAKWLMSYVNETGIVYADDGSRAHVLASYGPVPAFEKYPIFAYDSTKQGGYVYLRYVNAIDGLGTGEQYFNLTELEPALDSSNRIYSSLGSEIYSSIG